MYTCLYLTVAQERYCAYQSYVYNESKVLTQGASTGPRRVEPEHSRIEQATLPRGEREDDSGRTRFSDKRHSRFLQRNGDQGDERPAARPILALPSAELEMPAPVLDAIALLEEKDPEFSVDVPTTSRES